MLRNKTLLISTIAGVFMLSGCVSVGPDYQAPVPLNKPFVFEHVEASVVTTERVKSWWHSFNNPALSQIVEMTLVNNPSIAVAKANVDAAFAAFDDSKNDRYPTADLTASYTSSDQASPGFSEQRLNTQTYRAGADLYWSLDLFGKLESATAAAKADAQAQRYAWQLVQVNLIAEVTSLYGQLRGFESRIALSERNIKSLSKTEAIISARLEAGYSSEFDLLRIQAQSKGVQASIPPLLAQLKTLQHTLSALAGQPPNSKQFLELLKADNNAYPLVLNKPLAIGSTEYMLKQRPDIFQAERSLAAANARVGFQKANLYPDIGVSGFIGFLSGDLANLGSNTKAWSITPSISWPAFDWGSAEAQVAIADANYQAAAASFKQLVLSALSEGQSALDVYSQSQIQLNLLRQQIVANERALTIAQIQYEAGSIDLLALLDVERTMLTAKDNLALTESQVFDNIVEVYRAFGGGLTLGSPSLDSGNT